MQNKFDIGDIVCSKKTGLPAVGKILSTFDPIYLQCIQQNNFPRWSAEFPNWEQKPVYSVLLNSPQKNVSWEEYTSNLPEGVDINKVKLSYNLLPIHNMVNYTEDDLELFES